MYGNAGPPKGYSTPRGVNSKAETSRVCQKCASTSHWTFECKSTRGNASVKPPAKLSRTQMLRWGVKQRRQEFVPEPTVKEAYAEQMKEVGRIVVAEAREEANRKRHRSDETTACVNSGSTNDTKRCMIRRPRNRAKWSSGRRMALAVLIVWIVFLLFADHSFSPLPRNDPVDRQPREPDPLEEVKWKRNKQGEDISLATRTTTTTTTTTPPPTKKAVTTARPLSIDPDVFREFTETLRKFEDNLKVVEGLGGNPEQPTAEFTDILELPGHGVPLPYDMDYTVDPRHWQACDQRNADFTPERDKLCQMYLSNLNNVRYIKAMSSRLTQGRTIKFSLSYAHNGIKAIMKVSQKKFYFEATSEFIAFSLDRALNFSRVPTSVYVPLPLDYMRVATAYSPLFSQWLDRYVFQYNYTTRNFVPCDYPTEKNTNTSLCSLVTIQLWMHDVHMALSTFLSLPYEYDSSFASKYFVVGHRLWPPKPSRLRALGDIVDRFIFDFLLGNTDRGMNDHNNFVYGGCSYRTTCQRPPLAERTKGVAKYAFIDHGSSLYSHKEPKGNAFTGDINQIPICRFRKSTYEAMKRFRVVNDDDNPLVLHIRKQLSPFVFRVTHLSVLEKVQKRMEKVLKIIDHCIDNYATGDVFSLPEYYEVRITEEETEDEEEGRSHADDKAPPIS